MKRRLLIGCIASAGVLALIMDAMTAIQAAQEAVMLCICVILPSLFPFFVLINLMGSTLSGISMRWLYPLEKLMHLPQGSAGLYLCGLLGGYPTGAQLVHKAWIDGALNTDDARRMLAFCSNAGPAFLFGIIGPAFGSVNTAWSIWLIHIISSVGVGCIYSKTEHSSSFALKLTTISFSDSLKRAVSVMGYVCGWVVLFRVIAAFLTKWFLWYLPQEAQVLFISLLELANGSTGLARIENEGLRMVIASVAVNFGGICVLMQTASVTDSLPIGTYLKGKLLQTGLAAMISLWAQYFLYSAAKRINIDIIFLASVSFALLVTMFFAYKKQINSRFSCDDAV